MNVVFRESFERDLKKLKGDARLLGRLQKALEQIEDAEALGTLANVERMQGWSECRAGATTIVSASVTTALG
ncbi:MAG: type II toxin-antitoxin system RelE/ParE family toxin [Bacteroidota bacterium]